MYNPAQNISNISPFSLKYKTFSVHFCVIFPLLMCDRAGGQHIYLLSKRDEHT